MRIPTPKNVREKIKSLDKRKLKRTLILVGALPLVLFLFVGIPYLYSSNPNFYSRYDNTLFYYQKWKKSTHADVDCVSCHAGSDISSWVPFRITMMGEFYRKTFGGSEEVTVFKQPENKTCLVCHSNTRKASPSGDLKIPHEAHVTVIKMKCVDCHEYAVHRKNPEGKRTPRMKDCLKCHNGERAVDRCNACHTRKDIPEEEIYIAITDFNNKDKSKVRII